MEDSGDEEDAEWAEIVSRRKHVGKLNNQNAANKEKRYAKMEGKKTDGMLIHVVRDLQPTVDVGLFD